MKIKRIHFLSGLMITLFIGVHLLNHFISVFGAEAHIEFMKYFRIVYRNQFVESLLLLTVMTQVISGLKLFLTKRKVLLQRNDKLQIWTGLYLSFFLIIHVSAIMIGRLVLQVDTNFYFGVAGLNTFPLNLLFIPYYLLAIIAFFGHISTIHFNKMKKEIIGISVKNQSRFILLFGVVLPLIILFGLTNGFIGVEIPKEYQIKIGK